jgi:hypothetical protein
MRWKNVGSEWRKLCYTPKGVIVPGMVIILVVTEAMILIVSIVGRKNTIITSLTNKCEKYLDRPETMR